MKKPVAYLEVIIYFKNGKLDWVSPIEDSDEDVKIDGNVLCIDNGYNTYRYNISELSVVNVTKVVDGDIIEHEKLYDFSKGK